MESSDEVVASDLQEFLRFTIRMVGDPEKSWMFRGQENGAWDLVCKIDRAEWAVYRTKRLWDRLMHENWLLKEFDKAARAHIGIEPKDLWESLALGQHHGLVTRLLDWTVNPLSALFFAVEKRSDQYDAAVWCYLHDGDSHFSHLEGPFSINEVVSYDPQHISPRIPAQASRFSAHPEPDATGEYSWHGLRLKVRIPKLSRSVIRQELANLGITRMSLFPDLDGVASHVNWRFSSKK